MSLSKIYSNKKKWRQKLTRWRNQESEGQCRYNKQGLHKLNKKISLCPNASKDISHIISGSLDMSDWPRNKSAKDMDTLTNDINESLRSFVNILEPTDDVGAIRVNQEIGRGGPLWCCHKKQTFPNYHDFCMDGWFYKNFFTKLQ